MTHCTSTAVALRLVCSAGSATFTTVPSMNAMLEARMVAARTQRPRALEHVDPGGCDRIRFSSHGSRTIAHIVRINIPKIQKPEQKTRNRRSRPHNRFYASAHLHRHDFRGDRTGSRGAAD